MAKNKTNKLKTKKKTKTKKTKRGTKKSKDTALSVAIQLNQKLNITDVDEIENVVEKKEKLIAEFMSNAKLHQEFSEKLENIDTKMNTLLSEILTLENKFSSIDDFVNKKGWELADVIDNVTEKPSDKILDSLEEN